MATFLKNSLFRYYDYVVGVGGVDVLDQLDEGESFH